MGLVDETATEIEALVRANAAFQATYPGDPRGRQPVHTVYVGAALFRSGTARQFGDAALRDLEHYGAEPDGFATAMGATALAGSIADAVHARVRAKLEREPVEDLRIDFEDGYGPRPDAEEDGAAVSAARELARAMSDGVASTFTGIRIKSLNESLAARSARTLELFVGALIEARGGVLPGGFVVTLPKVQAPEQPRTLARWMDRLEQRHGLARGSLRFEMMIETPQGLVGADGRFPLPAFLDASEGRCTGVHLGVYDFTAACGVAAAYQATVHPMCELARNLMKLACGGRGVFVSDGATNVLPVGPHQGDAISEAQRAENRDAVHRAWRLSYARVRHALEGGFYQGWDLHPAQLPVRYAATFAFFLEGFAPAAARLRAFVDSSTKASAQIADEPATGQALLDYVRRAFLCGAIGREELATAGLTPDDATLPSLGAVLRARSAET
jgi:citrate lyase beta subunit